MHDWLANVCSRLHTPVPYNRRPELFMSRLNLDGVTSASALATWQQLRTQQWAVIDGVVGEPAAARMRREIIGLWEVSADHCVAPSKPISGACTTCSRARHSTL